MAKKKTEQEKKNAKYWKDRAIAMEEDKEKAAEALSERTRKAYIRSFKRLNRDIDALYAEILDKGLEEMMATDLYNLQRYVALRDKIAKEVEGLAVQDNERLSKLLNDIAVGTYESNCKEMGIDFTILSEQQAKAIASENWTGVRFYDGQKGRASDHHRRREGLDPYLPHLRRRGGGADAAVRQRADRLCGSCGETARTLQREHSE